MTREGNAAKRAEDATAGPWTKWKGSRVGRYIRFAEKYLRPPRGSTAGQLIKLLPWQKDFVEEYFAAGISAAILGMGRGGGKSTFVATLATFDLFEGDSQGAPVVPVVAAALNQAKSEVYGQAVFMVQSEPALASRSLVFSGIGSERIIVPRTSGVMVPKAADPDTLQGLNIWPAGYVDEVGHIKQPTWDAVLLGRKRKGARILGAGTWGPDQDSPLYQVRRLVRDGNPPDSLLWRVFQGKGGAALSDEKNWYLANPSLKYGLPDIAFLRNAVAMSPEASFRTYHLNEPDVVGHDSWLGPDARIIWDGLEDHWTLSHELPAFVGLDIGLVRDSSACVIVQEREDGRLHATSKIWMPLPGQTVDIAAVVGYVRQLRQDYNVRSIAYDPRLFELPAIMLADSGFPMVEVNQSIEAMTPIVGALFELIHRAGLSHERDESFAAQVINAVPRLNERGFTLSKSKSAPRGHIDAAVALALAVDRYHHRAKKKVTAWVG